MNVDWKLISEVKPPQDGTKFQVAQYGQWYPICKADDVGVYELTPDDYGLYKWELIGRFIPWSGESVNGMYWASHPELPE